MRFSVVSLVLAVMVSGGARACVGARPLAMGGAFVAVADDVNATYWNPAGLSQIPAGKIEITGMHTTTNRDQINYQDYAAAATTLAVPKLGESGTVSIGASYVMSRQLAEDRNTKEVFDFNDHWMWVSGAAKIKIDSVTLSAGANLRTIFSDAPRQYDITTDPGLDLAVLGKSEDRLSAGLLIQDANEPRRRSHGIVEGVHVQNWRPGIAFRPARNSVLSLEIYDAMNRGGARSFRAGGEIVLGPVALRAGYYGFGGGSEVPRSVTFGAGVHAAGIAFDAAVMAGDLDNTVLLSGSFQLR